MKNNLKICIKVDNRIIFEFAGKINQAKMILSANQIEVMLLRQCNNKERVKNVFELFIETAQNILNYSYRNEYIIDDKNSTFCNFSLYYFTENDTYVLESCNLIEVRQQEVIEKKLEVIQGLDQNELRKLLRQKSRTAEDRHALGAGLGYIVMARKSRAPIEVDFVPYQEGVLLYKQKLYI
ncbi:MAG TPA: hypothetical protein ENK82_08925 [Campylobacterales bacterium]|nr:hypothetical protein [Campylobacterales bacterium]